MDWLCGVFREEGFEAHLDQKLLRHGLETFQMLRQLRKFSPFLNHSAQNFGIGTCASNFCLQMFPGSWSRNRAHFVADHCHAISVA